MPISSIIRGNSLLVPTDVHIVDAYTESFWNPDIHKRASTHIGLHYPNRRIFLVNNSLALFLEMRLFQDIFINAKRARNRSIYMHGDSPLNYQHKSIIFMRMNSPQRWLQIRDPKTIPDLGVVGWKTKGNNANSNCPEKLLSKSKTALEVKHSAWGAQWRATVSHGQ